jgi:hypothetical protein
VKLIPIDQLSRRGIVFDAGRTKPLSDEFLTAPQTLSLFPVDDDRACFQSISGSHGLPSLIGMEMSGKCPILLRCKFFKFY